jgi:periplasmic protein TonB
MKFNILNWKIGAVAVVMGAGISFASCNNENTANNSTNTETDTSGKAADTSTVTNPVTATDTLNTIKPVAKKTRKVSVAMATENKAEKMSADNMGYYNYAEISPGYTGGNSAIEDYINNNIEYPQQAVDNNAEGTVKVQFGIDENGKITNVKTIGTKLGYGLDEEAVKVISNMPKWTPGQVKGKKVKTLMILPITYRIEG